MAFHVFGFGRREPYRIGLALSGGGARGIAHAGAIQALSDCGVKPDIVAGVSAGSIAAVMYSAGLSTQHMVECFKQAKFKDFVEMTVPTDGFFRLDKFREFLRREMHPYVNLEDLPIKTVIGVTNLDTGRKEMFEEGPIADIVAASCSIPIVFKPAIINGVRYVDGGVRANLPAWTIRHRCRYLIGVNCSPLTDRRAKNNMVDIALRSYELLAKTNVVDDMEMCDMLVRTDDIAKYQVFNLKELDDVYECGYRETLNHLLYHGFHRR